MVADAVSVTELPRQILWLPAGVIAPMGRGFTRSEKSLAADVQPFRVDVTEKLIVPFPALVKTGICPVPEPWVRPNVRLLAVQL